MSSKVLKPLAIVAAVAVNVIPGVGQALSAAIGSTLLATAAIAAVTTIGLQSASSYLGPKTPKGSLAGLDRLNASLVPSAPRKIAFGRTAFATDIRYVEPSGSDQEYVDYIIHCASHRVESFDEIWFEDKLAWSAGAGVQSTYAGYLTVSPIVEGSASAYHVVNGGGKWGAAQRLTGCASVHLRIRRTGTSKKAQSPLVNGMPSRLTIIGRGMPLYHPAFDSTVAGGSGTMRIDDQSTWAWSYAGYDLGMNPALQALAYHRGWRINGLVSSGLGMPAERLDLPAFAAAAATSDEGVALVGGGSQRRYETAGLFSDFDDPRTVQQSFADATSGWFDDSAGKLGLFVAVNDLAGDLVSLGPDDVLSEFKWKPFADNPPNVVRGRNPDPASPSLYQLTDYPEVSITSVDGIDRPIPLDLGIVQDKARAQRLAKIALQRQQYQGLFSATFGVRAWQLHRGQPIRFSFPALGWSNLLFRVVSWTVNADATVRMDLRIENVAIYAWDREESPAVTPAAPISYDPLNAPLIQAVDEAAALAGKTLFVTSDLQAVPYTAAGAPVDGSAIIHFTATKQNTTSTVSWSATTLEGAATGWPPAPGDTAAMSVAYFDAIRGGSNGIIVTATLTDGDLALTGQINVIAVKNGSDGLPGTDGIDGATFYTWFAYADAADGSVNFTTAGPGTRGYIGIAANKTTPTESANPADYSWTAYKGPTAFGLVDQNGTVVSSNKIIKVSGFTGWDSSAHSTEAYVGGAAVSFSPVGTAGEFMVGLNTDPTTDNGFTSIDFAIDCNTAGTFDAYESGTAVYAGGAYSPSDAFQVHYDGAAVRYMRNGAVFRTIAAAAGLKLYLDTSFYTPAATVTITGFTAAGTAGVDGPAGADGADGSDGVDGADGLSIGSIPAVHAIACAYDGTVKSGKLPVTSQVLIYFGPTDVAEAVGYTISTDNCTATVSNTAGSRGLVTFTALAADTGSATITATYGTRQQKVTIPITKVRDGDVGGGKVGPYNAVLQAAIPAGGAVQAAGNIRFGGTTSGGTLTPQLQSSPAGAGSWTAFATGAGEPYGPAEGVSAGVSGSVGNGGTTTMLFDIRMVYSGGSGTIDQSQSYVQVRG